MKTGIVGFAGAGKTTVFNALTGLRADTGFGNKEQANLGMIKVPDSRVDFLTQIYTPKKSTLAEVGFVDVAGPEGKSSESGLHARVVSHMREADALVQVVRAFDNPALSRAPDPARDFNDFEGELVITDLMQVENRLIRLKKEGKKDNERALMERLHSQLDEGRPLRLLALTEAEHQLTSGFRFLSLKPCIALVNLADGQASAGPPEAVTAAAADTGVHVLAMAARAEEEIAELDATDQMAFLADLGLSEPARDRFVNAAYGLLDLISFLTAGEDECRAWPIRRGTVARRAAGKIHSDIERGFIRAEVIAFADFELYPSEAKCREAGKMRLEGKDYVVQDGDIMNFRFNV